PAFIRLRHSNSASRSSTRGWDPLTLGGAPMKYRLLVGLVMLLEGCGGDPLTAPLPPLPVAVAAIDGDQQLGFVHGVLDYFRVKVMDSRGNGIPKVNVTWSIVSGSGTFDNGVPASPTGDDGRAEIRFLPDTVGRVRVSARVATLPGSPAIFT